MDSGNNSRIRMNAEGDRLSSLPDDLIHKILSFIDIKQAIETSALSSRWRYIWTSMPYLNFSTKDFHTFAKFSKFATRVLSDRNNQIEVSSIGLTFHGKPSRVSVKRIMDYACAYNVQQLNITCLRAKNIGLNIMEFPLSLFSSPSLKHLTFTWFHSQYYIMKPPTWELPALTTLNLHHVTLRDDNTDKCACLLSNCANLKNLTLSNCRMIGSKGFNIFHPGISNLTLEYGFDIGNVVTPQLKNLTIRYWSNMHKVFAPDLASLHYKDHCNPLQLSSDLRHLEKADICIHHPSEDKTTSHNIVCMVQRLHGAKFLTLNLEIVEVLSASVELISHQPSPFVNLKILKIYPDNVNPEEQTQPKVTMSTEVKNYLLNGSPSATFTMVSHEEIRTAMNVATAQKFMIDLQVLLDRWKENSERNTVHMEQDKAPMESPMATVLAQGEIENHRAQPDTKVKQSFGERMIYIKSYWKDLNEQLEKGYKDISHVILVLQTIQGVLTRLPTSHRDKLQARFSGLCAEADIIMDNMLDRMKMQCDKKPSRFNVLFQEIATSSRQSS